MSTLGRNGRFANQLFQYAFLRICAARRGASLQTPAWPGQELFGFHDAPIAAPAVRVINGEEAPDPDLYLNRDDPLGEHVEFWGYFQYHTRHYRPHQDFLRRLFTLRPELKGFFDGVISQIRATGRPLVAIHLRRGDYGQAQFFRAPVRWYADWLRALPGGREPIVYLATEEPAAWAGAFHPRRVLHAGLLPNLPPALAFALDFYVLTQADALAISNSSFSFMAAMLSERAAVFVRPTLEDRRLVSFDPWDAPVLLPRCLQPGEQEELDAVDQKVTPIARMQP
jgi:hypothetical protein